MRALLRFSGQPAPLGVSAAQVSREDEPIAYATAVSRMKKLTDEIGAARAVLFDCLPEFKEANLAPLHRLAAEVLRDRDRAGDVWMQAVGKVGSRHLSVEKMVRELADKLAAVRSDQTDLENANGCLGDLRAKVAWAVGLFPDAKPKDIELRVQKMADGHEQLARVFFETGGATEREGDGQRAPSPEEMADHTRDLHKRFLHQREIILKYQDREAAISARLTRLAERLGVKAKGKLVTDADLLDQVERAAGELEADREGAVVLEALAGPEIPAGFQLVEPSRPGRWAVGDRFEVFESTKSLADAIRMCRDTLAHRRAQIG
jgi:hypothetical protein